ncbi:MAG: glycine cleavage system protein GcvH [Planctomycetota bacterium]|nr:glycine cleavage system protein GcvH [Planctomycetota bacterium]
MSNIPRSLRYTKDHEWVLIEDDVATVGITDYAQHELGDITFVELPEEDVELRAGDEAATIESVKASSPVYAPVSGKVTEVNSQLEESPEDINHDPYGAGWLFRIEMSNPEEIEDLMGADDYEELLEKGE